MLTFGNPQGTQCEGVVGLQLVGLLQVSDGALEVAQLDLGLPSIPQDRSGAWLAPMGGCEGGAGPLELASLLQHAALDGQHCGAVGCQLASPACRDASNMSEGVLTHLH